MKITDPNHPMFDVVNSLDGSVDNLLWPEDAKYRVEYRLRVIPLVFSVNRTLYFTDDESLENWIDEKREWACISNGEVSIALFVWDHGPKFKSVMTLF